MPKQVIPKITYTDKVDLLDDVRVPEEKKITAANLNEIKAVVNNVIENGVGGSTVRVGGNTFDEAEEMELWMTTSTKEKSLKVTKNNIAKLPVVEDTDSNIYPKSKAEYVEYHGKVDGAVNTHNAIETLADQRVKVGDDTYETATPKGILLKVKTQAEMLAGQRNLSVQDKRLLTSGVVHDDTGLDAYLNALSNHNILINSDFTNPINQRGLSVYDYGVVNGYTIDRWFTYELKVSVNDGCITLENPTATIHTFRQFYSTSLSGLITYSCKIKSTTKGAYMRAELKAGGYIQSQTDLKNGVNVWTFENEVIDFEILVPSGGKVEIEYAKAEYGANASVYHRSNYFAESEFCRLFYSEGQAIGIILYAYKKSTTCAYLVCASFPRMCMKPDVKGLTYIYHNAGGTSVMGTVPDSNIVTITDSTITFMTNYDVPTFDGCCGMRIGYKLQAGS